MKDEYDFSEGERGRFYNPVATECDMILAQRAAERAERRRFRRAVARVAVVGAVFGAVCAVPLIFTPLAQAAGLVAFFAATGGARFQMWREGRREVKRMLVEQRLRRLADTIHAQGHPDAAKYAAVKGELRASGIAGEPDPEDP